MNTPLLFTTLAIAAIGIAKAVDPASTLEVLAYNDVYELTQDDVNGVKVGGPSRVIPMVKDMRQQSRNSLVLLAGDTMSPSLWSNQFKGLQMMEAHNALGLDFACLGNHEFDFGIEGFDNVTRASKFVWLNANCYEIENNKLLRGTEPHAVKTFGNYKVGLFGIMYDMKDSSKGLKWTDPIQAAKEQVRILREEKKVDLVIALTHQDFADDNNFANQVAGVDIIYGGHDHNNMKHSENKVPYLKADMNYRTVWRSHIDLKAGSGGVHQMTHELVEVTSDMKTDSDFDLTVKQYEQTIDKLFNVQKGALCEPFDLQEQNVRFKEMPIGNFFADTTLNAYGPGTADVGTWNGGGIRTDTTYPAGPLTLGTLIGWSPFGNTVVVVEVDGANLKKYITSSMTESCGDNGVIKQNGFYVNSAGFKYEFGCTGSDKGQLNVLEWFKHPTKKGDIKDDEVFKMAMSDFLYQSKFKPFATAKRVVIGDNEAMRMDAVIVKYLESLPDKTICNKPEGRSAVVWGSGSKTPKPTTDTTTAPPTSTPVPSQSPGKPDEKTGKPTQNPGKPDQKTGKPTQNPGKPDQKTGKPTQNPGKPDQKTDTPTLNPGKPSQIPPTSVPGTPVPTGSFTKAPVTTVPGKPTPAPSSMTPNTPTQTPVRPSHC